VNNASLLGAVD